MVPLGTISLVGQAGSASIIVLPAGRASSFDENDSTSCYHIWLLG